MCGVLGGEAVTNMPLDVLHHDDRVVDHNADGEHETQQREIVERKAKSRHDRKSADQRNRNRHDRDDGCAPTLQEQDDDQNDQSRRFEDGFVDLIHGLGDEFGRIEGYAILQAGGEIAPRRLHCRNDTIGGLQGVGAGLLEDLDRLRRYPV